MNERPVCDVCGRELVIVGGGLNPSGVRFVTMQCPRACPIERPWDPERERREMEALAEAEREFGATKQAAAMKSTIGKLASVARATPRELVCPVCGGEIMLRDGVYLCRGLPYDPCWFESWTLAALARKGGP